MRQTTNYLGGRHAGTYRAFLPTDRFEESNPGSTHYECIDALRVRRRLRLPGVIRSAIGAALRPIRRTAALSPPGSLGGGGNGGQRRGSLGCEPADLHVPE